MRGYSGGTLAGQQTILSSGNIETFGLFLSSSTQPQASSACTTNNGGCEHICVPDQSGFQCMCQFGFTQGSEDTSTCHTSYVMDNFLLVGDTGAHKVYQVQLGSRPVIQEISTGEINQLSGVTYDLLEHMVIWTDRQDNGVTRIRSLDLSQADSTPRTKGTFASSVSLDSIVFDSLHKKLIFSDRDSHQIAFRSLDETKTHRLVQLSEGHSALGIQLDMINWHLYWIDDGSTKSIERVSMYTGSNRQTLVSSGLQNPLALALFVAENELYWSDGMAGASGRIEVIQLDGSGRSEVYSVSSEAYFGAIAAQSDIVYLSWKHQLYTFTNRQRLRTIGVKGFADASLMSLQNSGNLPDDFSFDVEGVAEWSKWSCLRCGGCGVRKRTIPTGERQTEYGACGKPSLCYRGRVSRREWIISPRGRYIGRHRHCCYDYRKKGWPMVNRPKFCRSLGGWRWPRGR